jgi:hypothetical protein
MNLNENLKPAVSSWPSSPPFLWAAQPLQAALSGTGSISRRKSSPRRLPHRT